MHFPSPSLLSTAKNRLHLPLHVVPRTLARLTLAVAATLLMSGVVSAQTPTPVPITVSLPVDTLDSSIPISTVFLKPVGTTNIDGGLNYVGFQGDFTFNQTVITFSSPLFVEKAGLTAGNWNVSANILPGPGPIRTLRVSAFSNDFTPLSGSGILYNLRMLRVSGTAGASTAMTWAADPNNFIFIDANLETHVPSQSNGMITITGPGATVTPTPSPGSPTPTATATATPTATATVTPTATATATSTAPATATPTPSATATVAQSPTPTATTTATPAVTATPTASPTVTPTATATPGGTATPSPTGTPVVTPTPTFDGNFVIGDLNAVVGNHVTFWSSQWAHLNSLSGGPAPNSFKGFARHPNPNPAECGGTWTSGPGSSSHPPEHVPPLITAIASSSITQSGSTIMGDVPILVVIATDHDSDGDDAVNSDEGHSRTGTVIAVVCNMGPTPTPGGTATPIPTATPVVTPTPTFEGNFVIGDLNAVVGNHVTFWSSQWAQSNSLSGGPAPNSFKGFARHPNPNPAQCGGTWTSSPGNSSHPPEHIPRLITAIAASSITQSGSTIMGNIPILVVIETDDHDAVSSGGESGTGTVIAVVCGGGPTPTPGGSATPTPAGTPVVTPTPTFEGNFVIGDQNAFVGNHVTFFSSHWSDLNTLTGGPAPEGFKGFARHPDPNPAECGGTWTSSSNSHPPEHIPPLITAIVASSITESDSSSATFMGNIPMLVVIATDDNDDDGPSSHEHEAKTGTVVSVICMSMPLSDISNISTRLRVETGDNMLIGGFIVTGTQEKRVLVRAIGPSLPLSDRLADPILEIHDASGQTIATNDNWVDAPNRQAIIDTTIPPSNNLESAILMSFPPGAYTATVRGANDSTGIGLVEAYDLDRTVGSRLVNISTRGMVQTSDNVLIAGMIVLGQRPQSVIVRAIAPSLDLPGKLADPTLELRDGNGVLIRSNDNWRNDQEAEIIATTIPPTNDLESAIVATLPANGASYTAIVRGVGDTMGIAVVEVYALQ
jgi:hypothetical protein